LPDPVLDTYIVCDRCGAHEVPGLAVRMWRDLFYCAKCAGSVVEEDSADDEGF